jgi:aryl-alcohol dehydrogenase-like predicted oxidoreductase
VALEVGCNLFDSAVSYSGGLSEEVLGAAIKGRRDKVLIQGQFPQRSGPNDIGSSRLHLMSCLEASLLRLGTDYIALWQMHGFDALTPIEETMRCSTMSCRPGRPATSAARISPAGIS